MEAHVRIYVEYPDETVGFAVRDRRSLRACIKSLEEEGYDRYWLHLHRGASVWLDQWQLRKDYEKLMEQVRRDRGATPVLKNPPTLINTYA